MFMHREGIWVIHPTLCFSPRIRSKVFSNTMQHFIIFTGDQRCWDHEGSDWSQAVQSHPGSRVEVTGHQCQEMTYCQGLRVGEQMEREHHSGLKFGSSHFLFPGGPGYL